MDGADKILQQFHHALGVYVSEAGCTVEGLQKILRRYPGAFETRFDDDKALAYRPSYVHACAASHESRADVMQFLLEKGGRQFLELRDPDGRTPLFLAKRDASPEIARTLIGAGAKDTPEALRHTTDLHFECMRARDIETAEAIIARRPDALLLKNDLGESALDYLLTPARAHTDIQELLIHCARAGVLAHPEHGRWILRNAVAKAAYDLIADVARLREEIKKPAEKIEEKLSYGSYEVKNAVVTQPAGRLVQKDEFGQTPLDYLIAAQKKFGVAEFGHIRSLLSGCARAGLLIHPTDGVWLPTDKSVYHMMLGFETSAAQPAPVFDFLPVFFNPENWEGRERDALNLRDDMRDYLTNKCTSPHKNVFLDVLNQFDFTPLERAAAARERRGNTGDAARFLRKSSGGAEHGRG